ncbi:hypothetical protein GCM10007857_48140 [Bradyrhizobium iriomotense]|uniref:SPOR domain-containing protein n=1 Tax=Bradyrhizobium iriomotense TaxID=441950 RepID=A0ABQ6B0Y1_9BRAD|nr:hypothetical protein GCM10007857_48140 [Bradyrhizobium iriomotense]
MAELARLIGQTDPFAAQQGRPAARPPAPPAPEPYQPPEQSYAPDNYQDHYEEPPPPPGPPSWMRRANVQPQPAAAEQPRYAPAANPVHPLQRFAAQQPAPEPDYQEPQAYTEQAYPEHNAPVDPSRYDDALYGQLEAGQQDFQRDPSYPDDPYAYQSDYPEDELEDEVPQKKRGGLMTVAAILALAVVGTGGAFAYKTYLGAPRSGEPPIIKADNTPTKVVPAPADGSAKVPDRMVTGDGGEKIVPREEAPIDVNAKSGGPRVVFPPLNPNANPPPVASVSPSAVPPPVAAPNNGTMPNSEPRRIRTLAVKGDQTDSTPAPAAAAAAKPAGAPKAVAAVPAAPRNPPTSANASANQPMSLAPQGGAPDPTAPPPTRMAATNPTQIAPPAAPEAATGGSYMVSVSSQDTEAAARESFRVAQGKYGSVLGSRSPVIKRVDLADNKVKYRAMVGPYRTRQEAVQFCTELKAAGGQCFIP